LSQLLNEVRTYFEQQFRLIAALRAAETKTERSGGAGRKGGVGKMNSRPALAAVEFRANFVDAPPKISIYAQLTSQS
jgi:hypothetical protein